VRVLRGLSTKSITAEFRIQQASSADAEEAFLFSTLFFDMGHAQLCITVSARTMEELLRARDAAEPDADVVELRLDGITNLALEAAIAGRRRPVIVTLRPQWEGGLFTGSEEEREQLLEAAVAHGAEYVDVEAAAAFANRLVRARRGRGVVLSMHTFGEPPADIPSRFEHLKSTGAEVIKLVIAVTSVSHMLPLFDIARRARIAGNGAKHVLIAMGAAGTSSRVLAERLGNCWTYAGDGVAPGQMPAERLLSEFQFRRITADAALYGVVGNPIAHSLSPAMHNAGFAALGLNAAYVQWEARDADDFVQFARMEGVSGASITAPFKVAMMQHVDEVDPVAQRVGAVNTLAVRNGVWIGTNTDVDGFLAPLMHRLDGRGLAGLRATVLGAGGAARAVAVALLDQGAEVTVCARRADAAQQLVNAAGGRVGAFPPRSGSWDLLVNATAAGSAGAPDSPMMGTRLDGQIVYDLVYAPAESRLLADAHEAGCLTIGGLEMLVAQAERQFELWTGHSPPAGLFMSAARKGDSPLRGTDPFFGKLLRDR
jgi:3-dehydroquinate dehydratase/shikimate dehydrogenase